MFYEKRNKDRFTFRFGLNEPLGYGDSNNLLEFLKGEIRYYIKRRFPNYIGDTVKVILRKDNGKRIYVWRTIEITIY